MTYLRRFKKNVTDFGYREYSAFGFGFGMAWFIYIMLIFFALSSVNLPTWVWYTGVIYWAVGVVLEFMTKRVLLIRGYQLSGAIIITVLTAVWLGHFLTKNNNAGLSTAIMLGLIICGSILFGFDQGLRRNGKHSYGFTGRLDIESGLIDPSQAPVSRETDVEKARHLEGLWVRLTPLFAGLGMFLVNVLSRESIEILMAVLVLLALLLGATGIGRLFHFTRSLHWLEQRYSKQIMLKR